MLVNWRGWGVWLSAGSWSTTVIFGSGTDFFFEIKQLPHSFSGPTL
jgi:hypothetical protein